MNIKWEVNKPALPTIPISDNFKLLNSITKFLHTSDLNKYVPMIRTGLSPDAIAAIKYFSADNVSGD